MNADPRVVASRAALPSAWRLMWASLVYHWRTNAAVALGVMAGTAVLTGALLVGDSVRGSLRRLTLERLGRIDEVLVTDRFFRQELADELAAKPAFRELYVEAQPVILLQAAVRRVNVAPGDLPPGALRQVNHVTLVGCMPAFWSLSDDRAADPPTGVPKEDEIVLNAPLARLLGVARGAAVDLAVVLPSAADIPRDSALGKKRETSRQKNFTLAAVVPALGMGRFSLSPSQQTPLVAYVNLAELQSGTWSGKANTILVAGRDADRTPAADEHDRLQRMLSPTLADYGLKVQVAENREYLNLLSERMMLDPEAEASALRACAGDHPQPVLTYLANTIAAGDKQIPYSTITALDLTTQPPLGPFRSTSDQPIEPIEDRKIVLNEWAAQKLGVQPGAEVRLDYFEPESTHGQARERSTSLTLAAIASLTDPATNPAADRGFTPTVKGLTDADSINNWEAPFPFDKQRVQPDDEQYWDDYGPTPKAFVSLAAGRRLWASRFGQTTSIRVPLTASLTRESVERRWQPDPVRMGFEFRPLKRLGLQVAAGTTPFNLLFLGFSMFIIAAAVLLVALLFRLGIEQRAREVGILLATGWRIAQVRRLLLGEGLIVALLGGLAGTALGVGYAWLMLAGLRTMWVAAITSPFLQLCVGETSLLVGFASGVVVSLLAIAWSVRHLKHVSVRRLLANQTEESGVGQTRRARLSLGVAAGSIVLAIGVSIAALRLGGEAQAGAFFGAGALVLTAALSLVWSALRSGHTGSLVTTGGWPLPRLALRNGTRHPSRSALAIGLVAAASFLIVAISAFHLAAPDDPARRDTGTGGFALVAESDLPVYLDINAQAAVAREPKNEAVPDLPFTTPEGEALRGARVLALRVHAGDDASCLNLYQPTQPRVLGVPEEMIQRGGFVWADSAAQSPAERANPWLLLNQPLPPTDAGQPVTPIVLDAATATYSLHLSGVGARYVLADGRGHARTFEVVGLLANSLFQGAVLMSEPAFTQNFPDEGGYRFFLIEAPAAEVPQVSAALGNALGEPFGFDVQSAAERLEAFLAVQNTYLSTFQSLGGLGLLLGTFGLATVQLRNVLERRSELALMRAAGFRRGQLARLVMWENAALLLGGLGVGVVAAVVAVAPHLGSDASIPWRSLAATLGLVAAVGLAAGLAAVRAVLRAPLLDALRGE